MEDNRTLSHPTLPPGGQVVLVMDDDPLVTEGLAAGLERKGRHVVTCNDLESAQLALEWVAPTHIVADIHISGPFGYEGLDLARYAKRHLPGSRTILITGDAPEALQMEASERGAVAFLKKPFSAGELDALIDLMTTTSIADGDEAQITHIPLLDEVLSADGLFPVFHPIVMLESGWKPFGFEALTRFRSNSPIAEPEDLFKYASRKGRVLELELRCIENTLAEARHLMSRASLFINIHPAVFASGRALSDLFLHHAAAGDLPLDRIVLEITEQEALESRAEVFDNFDRLRELGIRFAFDDFGVAYSHLPLIGRILPRFLKISQDFGTRFERDLMKVRVVTNFMSLARDFGCELILEGIEDTSTADAAAELGIRYGQGFLFGKPTPAAAFSKV